MGNCSTIDAQWKILLQKVNAFTTAEADTKKIKRVHLVKLIKDFDSTVYPFSGFKKYLNGQLVGVVEKSNDRTYWEPHPEGIFFERWSPALHASSGSGLFTTTIPQGIHCLLTFPEKWIPGDATYCEIGIIYSHIEMETQTFQLHLLPYGSSEPKMLFQVHSTDSNPLDNFRVYTHPGAAVVHGCKKRTETIIPYTGKVHEFELTYEEADMTAYGPDGSRFFRSEGKKILYMKRPPRYDKTEESIFDVSDAGSLILTLRSHPDGVAVQVRRDDGSYYIVCVKANKKAYLIFDSAQEKRMVVNWKSYPQGILIEERKTGNIFFYKTADTELTTFR